MSESQVPATNHFEYKTICITGASSGIGRALAEQLAALPHSPTIIAVGRRSDRLQSLAQSSAAGGRIIPLIADIGTGPKTDIFVHELLEKYPSLDAIIANAGIQHTQDWSDPNNVNLEELESELTMNYVSTLHLAKGILAHFKSHPDRKSAFITVTSGLAAVPSPSVANYSATKAAVRSLTLSLRGVYHNTHIAVREIAPPLVESELHDHQGTVPTLSKIWIPLQVYVPYAVKALVETDAPEITYGFVETMYEKFERGKWGVVQMMLEAQAKAKWGTAGEQKD